MASPLEEALTRLVDVLENHAVPYAVTGSFALAYHGVVRATADVDVKVAAAPFAAKQAKVQADLERADFMTLDPTSFRYRGRYDAELYPVINDLDQEAFKRRAIDTLLVGNPKKFWIVQAEDLVLIKLREFARTGDFKHADDAKKLVATKREAMDTAYLEDRIERHGLGKAWKRATMPVG